MKLVRVPLFLLLGTFLTLLFFNRPASPNPTPEPTTGAEKSIASPETRADEEEAKEPDVYYAKNPALKLKVAARSYLVGDLDTGEIILSKNEKEQLPIASVSKLMTALVASESLGRDEVLSVSKKAVATEGGNGNLRAGEKIKAGNLLYPLLPESSNDAAEVLAEEVGRDTFLAKMNGRSRELEMQQTRFRDPSGLSPGNQSSVLDLFKLVQYLSKEKSKLLEITTFRSFASPPHFWQSNNQFLKETGYRVG